jgi:hypothetical protein
MIPGGECLGGPRRGVGLVPLPDNLLLAVRVAPAEKIFNIQRFQKIGNRWEAGEKYVNICYLHVGIS